MLKCIQIVAANIHILAIPVLGPGVVLLVGTDERCGVHVGEHTGIIFSQPVKPTCLIGESGSSWQGNLKCLYIKFAVSMEALGEILLQYFHFLLSCTSIGISIHNVFYHFQVSFLSVIHFSHPHEVVSLPHEAMPLGKCASKIIFLIEKREDYPNELRVDGRFLELSPFKKEYGL